MKVILKEFIENLGNAGDIVSVKRGYARNYLIPRNLAIPLQEKNIRIMEHQKRIIEERRLKEAKDLQSLKKRIESLSISIPKKSGEEDRIFGSVTPIDIEEALMAEGISIDRKNILLEEPIKKLGLYTIKIKISRDFDANLKVWVIKKEGD